MTEIFFIIRHAPFWTIPVMILTTEFGYLFWLRKNKRGFKVCVTIFGIAFCFLTFYVYSGGPERSVQKAIRIIRSFD